MEVVATLKKAETFFERNAPQPAFELLWGLTGEQLDELTDLCQKDSEIYELTVSVVGYLGLHGKLPTGPTGTA